jgi:predicted DNA-binding transcriptional regulator AlpA
MHEFLTLEDFADVMGAPIATLRHWRLTGYGPKSAKIGRRVLYRRRDVESWIERAFAD